MARSRLSSGSGGRSLPAWMPENVHIPDGMAEAVAATVEGPVAAVMPASILQHHAAAKLFIDEAAAASLELADYYRWVYNGKPEWQCDA
jgi:hypothetical protein